MGGAKNPFFSLSIPKNHKKVNAICNVQMATRALEVVVLQGQPVEADQREEVVGVLFCDVWLLQLLLPQFVVVQLRELVAWLFLLQHVFVSAKLFQQRPLEFVFAVLGIGLCDSFLPFFSVPLQLFYVLPGPSVAPQLMLFVVLRLVFASRPLLVLFVLVQLAPVQLRVREAVALPR